MINLSIVDLCWADSDTDDTLDLCAHGKVCFEIDNHVLLSISDGEWTVSAAALYLLRTLEEDHTTNDPLFEQLFPCCGFNMYAFEESDDVVIMGCPSGKNFEIRHINDQVEITDIAEIINTYKVDKIDWTQSVLDFSREVWKLYRTSEPKKTDDDELKKGYRKFIEEWSRRYDHTLMHNKGF
jgi:hypothetical protein